MKEAIAVLLLWIAQNSDYKDIPPPKHWAEVSETRGADAYYRCSTQTLHVKSGINLQSLDELALVLHELTHHAQCVTGWTAKSPCEREREAYALQGKFIQAFVADPEMGRRAIAILGSAADRECENLNRR